MKKRLHELVAGVLIGTMLTSAIVFAKNEAEMIEALYSSIKIYVDGVKIEPKDASGKTVEPFIYNGTTYLPVRAVGEALGKTVTWDGATQSVYLGEKPGDVQYMLNICPIYDGKGYRSYLSSEGETVSVAGKQYTNSFTLGYNYYVVDPTSYALFNLNGKYKKVIFKVGRVDETYHNDTTLNVYLDGILKKQYNVKATDLPKEIEIDLNYAMQLKIETKDSQAQYAIVNAVLK